ncbi:MAG: hypothetical protein KJN59_11765 [Bacteroidia bacterium]|nr:hypothetical protein [Bacteroidia bacterium]
MINFLRKIRYTLMEKGNTGKYLKYAIGEILLVMIGILLALQVNNWNESRLERKEEIEILKEVKSALNYDLEKTFRSLRARAISRRNLSEDILNAVKDKRAIQDSIDFIFLSGGETFRPSYTAYKALESKGIDLIKNDSIKYGIIQIYDSEYVHLKLRLEQNNFANLRDFIRPFLFDNFQLDEHERLSPINPEALLDNHKFKIILFRTRSSDHATLNQLTSLEQKIKKVIDQIDEEIQVN